MTRTISITYILLFALSLSCSAEDKPASRQATPSHTAESVEVVLTQPRSEAKLQENSPVALEGIITLAPGALPANYVMVAFQTTKKPETFHGQYVSLLGQREEGKSYQKLKDKDNAYSFRFQVTTPSQLGKYRVVVEAVHIPRDSQGNPIDSKISRHRPAMPTTIEIVP